MSFHSSRSRRVRYRPLFRPQDRLRHDRPRRSSNLHQHAVQRVASLVRKRGLARPPNGGGTLGVRIERTALR
jgi:hypothetical protein